MPVAFGFSNCGFGFYRKLMNLSQKDRQWLLSSSVGFPDNLTEYTPYGDLRWVRPLENVTAQMYHFVFFLRKTMEYLAEHPVSQESVDSTSDIAHLLTQLRRGLIFIRSGQDVGEVDILGPKKGIGVREPKYARELMRDLLQQTRQRYAKPRSEIENVNENSKSVDIEPDDVNETPAQPQSRWEDVE